MELFLSEKQELNKDPWFTYHKYYEWIADHKNFTKFVEVGVWKGQSISYLANLLRERKNLELYAVNLWGYTYGNYLKNHLLIIQLYQTFFVSLI